MQSQSYRQYWAYSRFDLAATTDTELPLVGSAAVRGPILGFGASDSGVSSEESQVSPNFISYNNMLFFRVADDQDAGSAAGYTAPAVPAYGSLTTEDKVTLQEVGFGLGTTTVSAVSTLHAVSPSAAVGDTTQCNADFASGKGGFGDRKSSVYGSDEGLATLTIYSLQLVTDPNTTFGELAGDGRLRITEFNESAGTLTSGAFVNIDDTDISDSVLVFDSRMSRNGDYIWAGWHQVVDAGLGGATTEDQQGVFAAEYITTRIQDDGTFPVPPSIGSTLSAPFQLNTIIILAAVGQPVTGYQFQALLEYRCGFQSDPDVMHIFFQHSDTTGDAVWDSRLTADLDPTGGCVPTVAVTLWEPFSLESDQVDWVFYGPRINHYDWKAFDSGEDGNAITVYKQDIDTTLATDFRWFSEKNGISGGKVEVDSGTSNRQASGGLVYFGATDPGSDIGTFDLVSMEDSDARPHGVRELNVMFYESQVNEVDGLAPYIRTRRFSSADLDIPFGDQFTPNAGTAFAEPFYPCVPEQYLAPNPLFVTGDGDMLVDGDTLAFYFSQGSRIYYQECSSGDDQEGEITWLNTDGVSNPLLVDDDNDEEITLNPILAVTSCTCTNLPNSMVFWTKQFGSGSGGGFSNRLQVRVRDGNNDGD